MRLLPSLSPHGPLVAFLLCLPLASGAGRDAEAARAADNPELVATLKMISAHATLRSPEVADPASASNRWMLDTMMRKSLESSPSPPAPPPRYPSPSSPLVGTLDGKFSINNRGAANYDLALPIPEARSSLAPDLSLSYYSGSGEDIVGRSFSFSTGFHSSITRGRTILARDDATRSAEFASADHFYLDGKRLLCVTPPETYGRPGSRYRTEVDSFVNIAAEGAGDEIDTFILRNQYGRTSYFGKLAGTDDGYQCPYDENTGRPGPRAATYALKRVEDPLGNYIDLRYAHKGFGEWVLEEIAYTGGPGTAPAYTIRFAYSARRARVPHYGALFRTDSVQLLESIQVVAAADGSVVAEHRLSYDPPARDGSFHLAAVETALAADLGTPLAALPPTRFRWSKGDDAGTEFRPLALPNSAGDRDATAFGDFNGDGKTDLIQQHDGLQVTLGTPTGLDSTAAPWIDEAALARALGTAGTRTIQVGDIDGNGTTDVLVTTADGKACFLRATGRGFTPSATLDLSTAPPGLPAAGASAPACVTLGDFDGDGRKDLLVHATGDRLRILRSNGSTFVAAPGTGDPGAVGTASAEPICGPAIRTLATDLNGDGVDDYVWLEEPTPGGTPAAAARRLRYALALPDHRLAQPRTIHEWADPGSDSIALLPGDFNGDGLTDFLVAGREPANGAQDWTLYLSLGHPTHLRDPATPTFAKFGHVLPAGTAFIPGGANGSSAPTTPTSRELECTGGRSLFLHDVNRDYRDDLVWFAAPESATGTAAGWWASCANGDGSFADPVRLEGQPWDRVPHCASGPSTHVTRIHDFDGDGLADWLVEHRSATGERRLAAAFRGAVEAGGDCPFPHLVTAITNGRGSTISIAYKAAKDDAIYTPGAPVEYPLRELRASTPVATDIWKDTAGDIPSQFTYRYAGNRIDFAGRGGLGFVAFTTLDQQTGFLKYQFLAHSFPMTGLTCREQTYRFWQREQKVWLKLISNEDKSVLFDAVVDPATGRPWGTVYPFVSRIVETRWPNNSMPDYTYNTAEPPGPQPLFRPTPPPSPAGRTTTSHWFDDQDTAKPVPTRAPEVTVPHVLQASYPASPGQLTPPADRLLPGLITFGNTRATYTDHGRGVFRKEAWTYRMPKNGDDLLTSLLESETSSENKEGKSTTTAPLTTYEYFANTALLARKTVDPTRASGSGPKVRTETHYDRDPRGRILQRSVHTRELGKPDTAPSIEIQYTAHAFDNDLDLPTDETEDDGNRYRSEHNRLFRAWNKVLYENGSEATAVHDGLGRQTRVANTSSGFLKTTRYAWTRPENEGWRRQQQVCPPSGVTGINQTTCFAVHVEKTGEPTVTTYRDRIDREIRVVTENPDGTTTITDTVYNLMNQLVAQSEPYAPGEQPAWTISRYDVYGNVSGTQKIGPAGTIPTKPPAEAK